MDNDALSSSGTTNPWLNGEDFGGYNMPTYLKSSQYYNGDARRGNTGSYDSTEGVYGCQYVWKHFLAAHNTSFYVYLWDNSFTEPNASYGTYSTTYAVHYGTINQNTAPGGWSYVGSANLKGYSRPFYMGAYTSGGQHYAGADAVKVVY